MIHIKKLIGYTIPLYRNKRILPYGEVVMWDDDDMATKTVNIKEDGRK